MQGEKGEDEGDVGGYYT